MQTACKSKESHIKNKQLSLSLRYIFLEMLLNGQENIVQCYFLYFFQVVAIYSCSVALVGQSVPAVIECPTCHVGQYSIHCTM